MRALGAGQQIVIRASGASIGKCVVVCSTIKEVRDALHPLLLGAEPGDWQILLEVRMTPDAKDLAVDAETLAATELVVISEGEDDPEQFAKEVKALDYKLKYEELVKELKAILDDYRFSPKTDYDYFTGEIEAILEAL